MKTLTIVLMEPDCDQVKAPSPHIEDSVAACHLGKKRAGILSKRMEQHRIRNVAGNNECLLIPYQVSVCERLRLWIDERTKDNKMRAREEVLASTMAMMFEAIALFQRKCLLNS